jgi:hypothetical protein
MVQIRAKTNFVFFFILFFKLHNNVLSKLRRTLTLLAHLISFFIRFDPI